MGHAFQQTLMDVLIRYHRMKSCKALWLVGTDHAGIATQMVVERQLQIKGLSKTELGRDAFIDQIWSWKKESGDNITRQLRRLGASVDWSRERFTMDEGLSKAVIEAFVRLFNEGLIYRGKRLVNWDPILHTAVSDLEVESEEENGFLYYIRYPLTDGTGHFTVATTRPETMLGDVAVAVHPMDTRFNTLIGKQLKLPLTERTIPIIADTSIDPEFGTGCVKITPAHDFNDYAIGERHHLPQINIFTLDATLNTNVPLPYQGLDRFVAREQIIKDLTALDYIEKIDNHVLKVPRGDRSGAILEPLLTDQWFVKTETLAKPAIEAVEKGKIRFIPENWSKTYFGWMHNIQDWCISRQLWWGHRIPAWYDEAGNIYVAHNEMEVRAKYNLPETIRLSQDEDVLDTWFSSALWPFSTLGWPEATLDFKTFYPTQVLVTGFDIIFFWVARMIMFGLKFTGEIPFHDVYIHGLIQDQNGQKMSKTKGNVLDPIDLIDGIDLESLVQKRISGLMQPQLAKKIEQDTRTQFPKGISAYGTDALRFTFCALATTGRHIRFDFTRLEGYRHFCNKLWNATRYVLMNIEGKNFNIHDNKEFSLSDHWIFSLWQRTKQSVQTHILQYRFDLAAQALYEFTWNEYCDWYLELSKPILNKPLNTPEDGLKANGTRYTLITILEELLRALHPFIPYITETLWQFVAKFEEKNKETIMLQPYPDYREDLIHSTAENEITWLKDIIIGIRTIRGELNVSPAKSVPVYLYSDSKEVLSQTETRITQHEPLLKALAKIESMECIDYKEDRAPVATALIGNLEIFIPMKGLIDIEAEIKRLEKDHTKHQSDLVLTENKLKNENFIKNAPRDIVQQEKNRYEELKNTLQKLEERLKELENIV